MSTNIWYHIIPKGSDLSKGILSPYYMTTHNMEKLALNSIDKYRDRLTTSWDIYPGRKPNDLSLDEVMTGLNKFRGDYGTKAIYAFKYPPASQMGPNMARILKHKDIYEIDISKISDLIKIDYDINDGPSEDWYNKVAHSEYFSHYDDNAEKHGKLLFAGIPHVAIITQSGRIPPQAIKKVNYFPLYHGSQKAYKILQPYVAGAYPDQKVVYATPMYDFALSYAGRKWDDLTINQTMVDDQQVLTEILPGAFDKYYNTKGYIHHISSEGFYEFNRKEWLSIWSAKPYKIETIPNILEALKKAGVELYTFPNLPPFIKDRKKYIYNICKKWNVDPTNYFKALEDI